jgi:hypothetical protein
MKGDFSRQTFAARRHYSGVLMQQGRVQLDADWNEQVDITRHRDETEAIDVIGGCGAPIHAAGFEITTDGKTLSIGRGRYYVDGLLAENDAGKIAYEEQNELDLPAADLSAVLDEMAKKKLTRALVYLDVWQRHVTALDDRLLREVALGGPDTATRVKTVWQVKVLPIAGGNSEEIAGMAGQRKQIESDLASLQKMADRIQAEADVIKQKLDQAAPTSPEFKKLQTLLQRAAAKLAEVNAEADKRRAQLAELAKKIEELGGNDVALACDAQLPAWDDLLAPGGMLNARTQPAGFGQDPCLPPPGAGYRRLENQLYRVEIHHGGALGKATFKWSRDNGTVVTRIESIKGGVIAVHDIGPDDALGFAHGQWVEISDDTLELNGLPGQLAQVDTVNAATREITLLGAAPAPLAGTPPGVDPARHPKLRRWDQVDQAAAPATDQGIGTSAGWLPLEDGISVQFSAGHYRAGDYWLIPARTATGELEWPPYEVPNLNPQPQPRRGIEHHYCRLALIRAQDGAIDQEITDCRRLFPPLTELTASAAKPALHVVKTNWENDTLLDRTILREEGLRITLDAAPDPASVSSETVIVTAEIPYVSNGQESAALRQAVIVAGQAGVDLADPNTIVWRPGGQDAGGGAIAGPGLIGLIVRPLVPADAAPAGSTLLRVALKGRVIWGQAGSPRRFLDGQAFGQPVADTDGQAHTALIFPSGDGVRASDFESWLYIGGRQQRAPLQVRTITFKRVVAGGGEQPTSAGVVTFPRDPAEPVRFKAGEVARIIEITFNREVRPEGTFDTGQPQGLLFELMSPDGRGFRRHGQLEVKGNLARFNARDPDVWREQGDYRLTVFGGDTQIGPSFVAASDGARLDGNFDGQDGGDLVLTVNLL